MKQINCTLVGHVTTVPVLRTDHAVDYAADLSEPGRAIFRLLDDETGGASILFGSQSVRLVLPAHPGAHEGPVLDYGPGNTVLSRLHIAGTQFLLGGTPWTWKGCSDFLLYQRFLQGDDLTPVLRERVDLGANLLRVFGMLHFIERFYPQTYGQSYYDGLQPFADLLASEQLRLEFVVFADQQEIRMPAPQTHFAECCARLSHAPNAVVELCNEYPKNGIDPLAFVRPPGILASAGSALADAAPVVFWDFFGWHGRRDWPKVTSSVEDMWFVIQHQRIPGVHDEPARQDRPAEFSPRLAAQIALSSCVLGSGATFHSISGLRSTLFTPFELECARAFFEVM